VRGGHAPLGTLAGIEVLPVRHIEQTHGVAGVEVVALDLGGVEEPVDGDPGVVVGHWLHPEEGHVVWNEDEEDVGPQDDTVEEAVVGVGQPRQSVALAAPAQGEPLERLGKGGARADPSAHRAPAARELGKRRGELGVDRGAVVALHEVLDDALPVRGHLVHLAVPETQPLDAVPVQDRRVPKA
jgi:hypothetical protein